MMWLTQFLNQNGKSRNTSSVGSVTKASQGSVEVDTSQPHSNIKVLAPFGVAYVPLLGEEAMVASLDGVKLCVGVVVRGNRDLQKGELRLFSAGGSSITLKNDGRVLIEGDVYINGEEVSRGSGCEN